MDRIAFTGNKGLITRTLNEDASAFVGDPVKWVGLISVSVTFTQPSTDFPSDDIPDAITVNGVPTGTGTITFRGINLKDYTNLTSVETNETGTRVRFGGDLPVKRFAFSANESSIVNDIEQKHIFYNCRMTNIPDFSSSTKTAGDPTLRDIAIPIALTPVFYNENGRRKRAIYEIMTSEDAEFADYKDTILFPAELV